MQNTKFIKVKKIYGYPHKYHKKWSLLVETENNEIRQIRFKSSRSAKRLYSKFRRGY